MTIYIRDEIGPRCITKEDGQQLFEKIFPILTKGEAVILDFKEVDLFASPFFNFAIGQILKGVPEERLSALLRFDNMNETGHFIIERVIENASQYYSNQSFKNNLDNIIEKKSQESN